MRSSGLMGWYSPEEVRYPMRLNRRSGAQSPRSALRLAGYMTFSLYTCKMRRLKVALAAVCIPDRAQEAGGVCFPLRRSLGTAYFSVLLFH